MENSQNIGQIITKAGTHLPIKFRNKRNLHHYFELLWILRALEVGYD